jgi:hypothetical protein
MNKLQLFENSIMSTGSLVVDRDSGIIRNVKILGYKSANGRVYTETCMRDAVANKLYEGAPVFADHLDKQEERKIENRLGRIINARYVEGQGVYADFEMLKTHPMAERIFEAAERLPDSFGFSHTAEGSVKKNKENILEVYRLDKIHTVDLVARAATVSSLSEGSNGAKMQNVIIGVDMENTAEEVKVEERCWDGYKPADNKQPYEKGSCVKEEGMYEKDADKKEMCDDDKKPKMAEESEMDMDVKHDKKDEDDMDDMDDDDKKKMKMKKKMDKMEKKESVENKISKEALIEYCSVANIDPEKDLIEDLSHMEKEVALKFIKRLGQAHLQEPKTFGVRVSESNTSEKDIAAWLLN